MTDTMTNNYKFKVGQLVVVKDQGQCYSTYYSKIGEMLSYEGGCERYIIGGTLPEENRKTPHRILARSKHQSGVPNLYLLVEEPSGYYDDEPSSVYLYGESGLEAWVQ